MLNATDRAKFRSAQESIVDMLGTPATWRQAKPPHASKQVVMGLSVAGLKDTEIINSYGVGARIFTIKARDIPNVEKFDTITLAAGERYTLQDALPIYVNGDLVFWKGIVKGK